MATIKEFPDIGRQFAAMKMRDTLIQALMFDKSIWGDCIRQKLLDKNFPIVKICEQIIADYETNSKAITGILGGELVNSIQQLLKK